MDRWLSIVLVGLGGLAIVACGGNGSDGPPKGSGGTGGTVLDCTTLMTPPAGCDDICMSGSDSECELGTFCLNRVCSAQCTETEGCGGGSSCNARGRCVPDVSTGGTGGSGNTGGSGCQFVRVTPSRSIPNVMFLVDQSGSMDDNDFGPMNLNRWTAAHTAVTSIVSGADDIVRFGLSTYTSRNGDDNPPCPRLPVAGDPLAARPRVDFALGSSVDIGNNSIYPSTYPNDAGEDTPTGDSIDSLVGLIKASPPPDEGPTIIVLATDGEPDSCEYPDPGNNAERDFSRQEVVDAAAAAHRAGIDLFVLWVGELSSTSTRDHLQEVADAGVHGARPRRAGGGTVWVGDDPASLQAAFQQIVSDSISCDVPMLERFSNPTAACAQGDVRLDGMQLSCPGEWRVKPGFDNIIELLDPACQTFKSGSVEFTADFPCGSIIVD